MMLLNPEGANGAVFACSPITILPIGSPLTNTSKNALFGVLLFVQSSVVMVLVSSELTTSCASFVYAVVGGLSSATTWLASSTCCASFVSTLIASVIGLLELSTCCASFNLSIVGVFPSCMALFEVSTSCSSFVLITGGFSAAMA